MFYKYRVSKYLLILVMNIFLALTIGLSGCSGIIEENGGDTVKIQSDGNEIENIIHEKMATATFAMG